MVSTMTHPTAPGLNDDSSLALYVSARSSIQQALTDGLKAGQLIILEDDVSHKYGHPSSMATIRDAEIEVMDPNFWVRVYLTHDLGCKPCSIDSCYSRSSCLTITLVAEAYMHGDFKTPNLKAILDVRYSS